MKTTILATTVTIGLATMLAVPGHAGQSASTAVQEMTTEQRKELMKKVRKGNVDKTTTASVNDTKTSAYDARGVVEPNAEVTLGAGVAAKIEKLPFKNGQTFKKGDELVLFDCARQRADLRGANASLNKASSFYQGKRRLKSRGAAGSQEVREAAADVASAKASVDALTEVISLCRIAAPFNGRVVERHAEPYEIPAANAPIMTVVDDSALELDLIVPSTWLRWVNKGSEFDFEVDELGKSFKARVERLGAKVDAVSQTIKLTGTFVQRPANVLAGMSGTAKFNPPTN
ncbi:efflux RND transporter periplasmic adaptor subunit [Pseudahrensia aquimaris]|uniref:Efflux RND transporter periplasmic adaptor subunit n=1 Tax=Pseudahrensia aquimaris TaxID=744461 RepID=A0ABW3FD55_9HYPH